MMYQIDFEEFLIANSIGSTVIEYLRECLISERSPIASIHERLLDLKRLFFNAIEEKKARSSNFLEEIDYLTNSGISLEVRSITDPTFPLIQSSRKNLLKLYLNDVGILTSVLYKNNINAILGDENSINLGSVYESTVAMQLASLGHSLFYYDNRHKGEVDFLIDDYNNLTVVPIEVKSGKDYTIHSALNSLLGNAHSRIKMEIVLSNSSEIKRDGRILYLPVYMVMLLKLSRDESKKTAF